MNDQLDEFGFPVMPDFLVRKKGEVRIDKPYFHPSLTEEVLQLAAKARAEREEARALAQKARSEEQAKKEMERPPGKEWEQAELVEVFLQGEFKKIPYSGLRKLWIVRSKWQNQVWVHACSATGWAYKGWMTGFKFDILVSKTADLKKGNK